MTIDGWKTGFNKSELTERIAFPVLIRMIFKCIFTHSETTADSPGNKKLHYCFVICVCLVLSAFLQAEILVIVSMDLICCGKEYKVIQPKGNSIA